MSTVQCSRRDVGRHTLSIVCPAIFKFVAIGLKFTDNNVINLKYYLKVEHILKEIEGTWHVYTLDHTMSKHYRLFAIRFEPLTYVCICTQEGVHIDYAYWASIERAQVPPPRLGHTPAPVALNNPARELEWSCLSGRTPEEVTLIKFYDSGTDRAKLTPLTFMDAESPAGGVVIGARRPQR
ncbi:hypothetical protein V8D89_010018 [Ganoderma adspersum]